MGIASPGPIGQSHAEQLLASCLLVDVSPELVRTACRLASREVRTLDAIHLASAQRVNPDEVLVYDARLADAASRAGFSGRLPLLRAPSVRVRDVGGRQKQPIFNELHDLYRRPGAFAVSHAFRLWSSATI